MHIITLEHTLENVRTFLILAVWMADEFFYVFLLVYPALNMITVQYVF